MPIQSILSFVKSIPATKASQNSQKADHGDKELANDTSNGDDEEMEALKQREIKIEPF